MASIDFPAAYLRSDGSNTPLPGTRGEFQQGGGDTLIPDRRQKPGASVQHRGLRAQNVLAAVGKIVLISDYSEYYRLAAYLTRYTAGPIAITMGVSSLLDLFQEQYYATLEGGILEAFGKLFTKDLRIYVYPMRDPGGEIRTIDNIEIAADLGNLFRHLVERGRIRQLDNFDESVLHIYSRDVLRRIKDNDTSWENMVSGEVAEVIKRRRFFGCHAPDKLAQETGP